MKPDAESFLAQPCKAVTIMGMSGAGKTHTSLMLAAQGWRHYSCDYMIGTKFLNIPGVTREDLRPLSAFVGQVGDPAMGGLPLEEFRRRQALYYEAECQSLREAGDDVAQAGGRNFINDSTGSLCEIEDRDLLDFIGGRTLFVYVKASPEEEMEILERARHYPKPLFFPRDRFDGWLDSFMREKNVTAVEGIAPDEFSRWVFPHLFASRLPKYQALADRYGVTVPSEEFKKIDSGKAFLSCIAEALSE
ncbi:MAG TPA: hypothetical protein VIF12_02140 [Micavibrio sp.]|jgi:hypothetical protein